MTYLVSLCFLVKSRRGPLGNIFPASSLASWSICGGICTLKRPSCPNIFAKLYRLWEGMISTGIMSTPGLRENSVPSSRVISNGAVLVSGTTSSFCFSKQWIEAISKKFFGPISVLASYFKSSEYCSMPAGWSSGPPWTWTKTLFLRWLLLIL